MRVRFVSAILVVLAFAALQYWWLPPDGFFSGDSGTKYLQARAVVEHGPLRPWVDGPSLDVDRALRWQEPFLLPTNGHLVGVFSWLLAVLTAPFLRILGLRGLYVVPALSLAVIFLAASSMGRTLAQRRSGMWSGWCAVLATPLLFYGAELWEHAPAVALSSVAGAVLLREEPRRRDVVSAGACLLLAFALRPEALVVGPALLLGRAWAYGPRSLVRLAGRFVLGAGAAAVVIAAMNHAVYGVVISQQVSTNLRAGLSYIAGRRDALALLVLPLQDRPLFAIGIAAVAAGAVLRPFRLRLAVVHAGIVLLLIVGVGLPLWRTYVDGLPWLAAFGTVALAHTWPLALLLGAYAAVRPASPPERMLLATFILTMILVFLTLPHGGGAQWGARFFLPAAPFAALLAVELGRRRETRILAAATIAVSIGVQVYGLTYLQHFKRLNAQIVRLSASLAQPGDVIVSDAYWYPELIATLYPTRRVLFASSPADFDAIATAVADHGLNGFWIAAATPITGYLPPASFAAGTGRPPFVLTRTRDAGLNALVFHRYERQQ